MVPGVNKIFLPSKPFLSHLAKAFRSVHFYFKARITFVHGTYEVDIPDGRYLGL